MEPLEWMVLVVAALAGGAVVSRYSITILGRLRGRRVTTSFTCPKRGCRADCTLVVDDGRGACVGVERCSVFGPNAPPRCEQDCAKLINLGIPLDSDSGAEPLGQLIQLEVEPEE